MTSSSTATKPARSIGSTWCGAWRRSPAVEREVLALRYLADLTEADVAAALGCSVGAVKRHGHRGIAALRIAQGAS